MAADRTDGSSDHTGGCVCGAMRYVARGDPSRVTICHCTWCQRRTGSAFGVEVVFQTDKVGFVGDSLRTHRHVSDTSGRWLDQFFCGRCGTNLGLVIESAPTVRSIPAGTFDDTAWLSRSKVRFRDIFMRSARDWSEVPDGAEQHEMHFRT